VATPALRRYDSLTDVIYYLFILGAVWLLCPVVIRLWWLVALILVSEAAVILLCYAKFGRYPATHSYLAKLFGLCLLAGLIALLVFDAGSWTIFTLTAIALAANSEIIAIHLLMDKPPVDVKSILALPRSTP